MGFRFRVSKFRVALAWAAAGLSLLAKPTFAKDVHLFTKYGDQVPDYDELVRNLQPKDVLIFSNGKKYQFESKLGSRNTSLVLESIPIVNGKPKQPVALRIPLKSGYLPARDPKKAPPAYTKYIDSALLGRSQLEEKGVPIPKLLDAKAGQYIATEIFRKDFDVGTFLMQPQKIDPETRVLAREALLVFARKAAPFWEIGDFDGSNLVYNREKNEWELLDWMHAHELAPKVIHPEQRNKSIFENDHFLLSILPRVQNEKGELVRKKPTTWARDVLRDLREVHSKALRGRIFAGCVLGKLNLIKSTPARVPAKN